MPAPLAKGIVITVTVLVAAGLAVYESPHVKQWVQSGRRKIAVALHNIGNEVDPEERRREDISMTEEMGQEAELRRRRAREEIMQRGALLESQRKKRTQSSVGSFDALVDKDGRLKKSEEMGQSGSSARAEATGIDLQPSGVVHRRPDGRANTTASRSASASDINSEQRSDMERNRLSLNIPSAASSSHPSESVVDWTPTSESEFGAFDNDTEQTLREDPLDQSEYVSAMSRSRVSTSTGDGGSDFFYAHPSQVQGSTNPNSLPFNGAEQGNTTFHEVSSAPSIASSMSHIGHELSAPMSDGTMSDVDYVRDVHTPISWSEVGSVISSNDGGHN